MNKIIIVALSLVLAVGCESAMLTDKDVISDGNVFRHKKSKEIIRNDSILFNQMQGDSLVGQNIKTVNESGYLVKNVERKPFGGGIRSITLYEDLKPVSTKKYDMGKITEEILYDEKGNVSGVKQFYGNGNLRSETYFHGKIKHGQETLYAEDGSVAERNNYKDGQLDGESIVYSQVDGKQHIKKEYKSGMLSDQWIEDENGKKMSILNENLGIIAYKTGYYQGSGYELICPAVILKLKNISGHELTEDVTIRYVFESAGEEMCNRSEFFQSYGDIPLAAGGVRQAFLKSFVGYKELGYYANRYKAVYCKVYIDNKLCKTFKISSALLYSNRL